jgi:hypothetical protein
MKDPDSEGDARTMSRQNITSPVSVLLAGVIVIILLLAGSGSSTSAIVRQQSNTPTWTPCLDDGSQAFFDCLQVQDDATATGEALTETAGGYPGTTSSAYPAESPTGGATGTTTVTTTSGSRTPTTGSATAQITRTPTPTATQTPGAAESTASDQPTEAAAASTPTPLNALVCTPNVPVLIEGSGPPRAPVLLYFGERPVGGGSIGPDGRFALKLIVGQERAGDYSVSVRIRGTSQVLRQVTCSVPFVAPTPLPDARPR